MDDDFNNLMVKSDVTRIKQVLLNFLSNAFKFTFKGSIKITVCSANIDDNDFIKFCVTDTGIGIKQEDQCKLFKLFSMINNDENTRRSNRLINPNGCGIGLTVSKRYIEYLNGSVSLESEFGKGTSVTFHIPLIRTKDENDISTVPSSNYSSQTSNDSCFIDDLSMIEETEPISQRLLLENYQICKLSSSNSIEKKSIINTIR